MQNIDEYFMQKALMQAKCALAIDEVPVGAVVVKNGEIIARAYNTRETKHDPSGHAEINALRKASKKLGGWNLHDCELYVTLEPCLMCTGAIINARINRIIYGASDPKAGCCGSIFDFCAKETPFNHHPLVTKDILQKECAELLTNFFKQKRKNIK